VLGLQVVYNRAQESHSWIGKTIEHNNHVQTLTQVIQQKLGVLGQADLSTSARFEEDTGALRRKLEADDAAFKPQYNQTIYARSEAQSVRSVTGWAKTLTFRLSSLLASSCQAPSIAILIFKMGVRSHSTSHRHIRVP
jgi:hypothetical protein